MARHRRETSFWKLFILSVFALGFFVMGTTMLWAVTLNIPSIEGFANRKVAESTKIYDRTGKVLLYDVHGTVRRTVVPLDQISRNAQNATIAIEDTEFYQHRGIKPTAIARAMFANITQGGLSQGGSTITQQVIKNTLLSNEKTFTRKIKEAVLAIKLERAFPKDKILELYFNETPYGGSLYGIEEASKYFFNKSAGDLTLSEAAYLAALPQAPTYYSPFGNHRDKLEDRKSLVLKRMYESGFITASEYEDAKNAEVEFHARDDSGIKAPHFVFYVLEYLEERYGVDVVNEGGLQVVTTLDYDLQQKSEEVVTRYALENEGKFNAKNAGLAAIDPTTGQVLAMVGSRGYFDDNIEGKFNITLAKRQPGSSFKPFVYAAAFEKGYAPETVVFDLRTQFSTTCAPDMFESNELCYSPDNYDHIFRGPISLRDALAQSVNIPAVKVLYLVGIRNALEMAERLGITTLKENAAHYGLPLVLGGGEVTLLEMVGAYGSFANDGVRHPTVAILKLTDPKGTVLEEYEENKITVLDPEVARTISGVLSDNTARTPAFGESSSLYFPGFSVAAKTGTTNDYRDAWVIGYTPSIAIGVWAGNNDNTPMEKRVAGFIVAPLWHEVMQFALDRAALENKPFTPPAPKNLSNCPPPLRGDWSTAGPHEILYSVDKDNPCSPAINPQNDPQFLLWEYPVALWAGKNPDVLLASTTPSQEVMRPLGPGATLITYPQSGGVVSSQSPLTITTKSPFGVNTKKVSFYLNDVFIGASTREPFSITTFPTIRGAVRVTAVAEGVDGHVVGESSFVVE